MARVISNTTAAADADAVVEVPALEQSRIRIRSIVWSFDADPGAATQLTVESPPGTTIFEVDITKGGPGPLPIEGVEGAKGEQVDVTLVSPGGGVTGKVNVIVED